ncbi:MAG TPA: hypothetical protein VFI31_07345 [Pirellulales bacterium]|nr:hypothetical protein [Pirellulales bacterium]
MAKGLADYRADRYAESIKWIQIAGPIVDGNPWDSTNFSVLAMAHHGLGHEEEAAAALAKAQAIVAKAPDPSSPGQVFVGGGGWYEWLLAKTLYREAEALLTKPATETGS